MEPNSNKVTIIFKTIKAADHFIGWFLDGGGEQGMIESAEENMDDARDTAFNIVCGDWKWLDDFEEQK